MSEAIFYSNLEKSCESSDYSLSTRSRTASSNSRFNVRRRAAAVLHEHQPGRSNWVNAPIHSAARRIVPRVLPSKHFRYAKQQGAVQTA